MRVRVWRRYREDERERGRQARVRMGGAGWASGGLRGAGRTGWPAQRRGRLLGSPLPLSSIISLTENKRRKINEEGVREQSWTRE